MERCQDVDSTESQRLVISPSAYSHDSNADAGADLCGTLPDDSCSHIVLMVSMCCFELSSPKDFLEQGNCVHAELLLPQTGLLCLHKAPSETLPSCSE